MAWASDTQLAAQRAIAGLHFGVTPAEHWNVTLPVSYSTKMSTAKKTQIVKAGARLAQVIQAIWP